jgi:hypothetical protein
MVLSMSPLGRMEQAAFQFAIAFVLFAEVMTRKYRSVFFPGHGLRCRYLEQ